MQALWTVPRQVGNDRSGSETRSKRCPPGPPLPQNETLPPQTVIAGAIIEFINTVVGVCPTPLGTALIAAGIALRMLDRRFELSHLTRE